MPSNFTGNYNLSQWERSDQVRMEDFNDDNAKIDEALKAEADARTAQTAALTAAVARLGNCRIEVSDYIGTGESITEKRFTFRNLPLFLVIFGGPAVLMGYGGNPFPIYMGSSYSATDGRASVGSFTAKWEGNQLVIPQANIAMKFDWKNIAYRIVAFYAMDNE